MSFCDLTEESIISSLGEFSKETNILKKYARRGQCFSTSKFIIQLRADEIVTHIPDVRKNEFLFTDGCGYISEELALQVSSIYGLRKCSAF